MRRPASVEGRGLDFALGVIVSGRRRKEVERRLAEALAEIERLKGKSGS